MARKYGLSMAIGKVTRHWGVPESEKKRESPRGLKRKAKGKASDDANEIKDRHEKIVYQCRSRAAVRYSLGGYRAFTTMVRDHRP